MNTRKQRLEALRRALNNIPDDGMDSFEKKALAAIWRFTVREIEKDAA